MKKTTESPYTRFTTITKRDGSVVPFQLKKITRAVEKSMHATKHGTAIDALLVAQKVEEKLVDECAQCPSVEHIQDVVEQTLMESNFHDVAKAYILYRNEYALLRKRNIFKKRVHLKPFEYPELIEYVDAVRHSYWIHTEFNYTSDIQDFKVRVTESERNALKNAMLAIAQIEVNVKTFYGYYFTFYFNMATSLLETLTL
ncbi:MAG: hypothetical protein RLZZ67_493 [Candidatus Parcubacteria bacterium]|jgi:ribonucleoside-diphosphate reductase beta chain